MAKEHPSITNIIIRRILLYGCLSGTIYILFFLFMRALGFEKNFNLRLVNFPILFYLTYRCLISLEHILHKNINYIRGMIISMFVAAVSGGMLAIFMFIYLTYIDPEFMNYVKDHAPFGWTLAPIDSAFWILHETLGFQLVYSFIVTEAYKLRTKRKEFQG